MTERVEYYATAKVTLTVEIEVKDTWGGDASVSQVHRQGAESALGTLRALTGQMKHGERMTIVGEPIVHAVTHTRKKT